MTTSSMVIKLRIPKMIVKIACTSCGGDLVRHGDSDRIGKKLECIPCDADSFHAYHCTDEKIDNVRTKIINNLGKDFEAIFK